MALMSASEAWFISFRIANLIRSSALSVLSASANDSTMAAGASGLSGGLEVGIAEQVADAAIQRLQLVVAGVLDDARDVAGDDRLVHARRVDQRQLVDVDLRLRVFRLLTTLPEMPSLTRVRMRFSNSPISVGRCGLQRRARIHVDLLLVAHLGPARAVHQHVGHLVHQRREREQQAMNREIPAVGQNLRHLARHGPSGGRFGGRCVHPRNAGAVCIPPPDPRARGSFRRTFVRRSA